MSVKTKRVITAVLAGVIVVAMMLSVITPVFAAEDVEDLEQYKQELEQQAEEVEALKNATDAEIAAAQEKIEAMKVETNALNDQINEVGARIVDLNTKIQENEEKLVVKEGELAQAKEDLKVYYAALKGRIQMMYESDRSSYLEVLLSASSISEFFSKLEYISQMVEYDNHIMEELDACRQTIQESKEAIETAKKELETDRAEEQKEQEALQAVLNEKQEKLNDIESDTIAKQLLAQEKEAQYANLMASISDTDTAIQNKQAEIAAAAAAEEEKKNNAVQAQQPSNNDGGSDDGGDSDDGDGDNGGGDSEPSAPSGGENSDRALPNGSYTTWPGIGNGMLSFPCDSGVLNSLYGPRVHPITGEYRNHGGIDFDIGYGCSIYAAADGVVQEAYMADTWGSGWGYHVVIQHDNGLRTLYAHCSDIYVTEGERVSTGQTIAAVGSTGQSTGPHLHFEVYDGGQVNPEDYL